MNSAGTWMKVNRSPAARCGSQQGRRHLRRRLDRELHAAVVCAIAERESSTPRVALPGATSFLLLARTEFGPKPTIPHQRSDPYPGRGDTTVVASKMLYASHHFWTGLDCGCSRTTQGADQASGSSRSTAVAPTALGGVKSALLRGIVRRNVQDGMVVVRQPSPIALSPRGLRMAGRVRRASREGSPL